MYIQNQQGSKFNNIYNKAYWVKDSLDSRPNFFDKKTAIEDYKNFMKEKVNCPTRAKIALKEVETNESIDYPVFYQNYKTMLEKDPEIDTLVKQVQEIENKQPKSLQIRNNLINNDRIFLDFVTPKLSKCKKLLLKLKMLF